MYVGLNCLKKSLSTSCFRRPPTSFFRTTPLIAIRSNKMSSITRCTRRQRSYCRNSSSVSCVMTSPPTHGTKVRSTCLSVAVRSRISKTTVRTSRSFMHANCDHGSVLQQSKQLMLCRSTCEVNGWLGSRVVSVLDQAQ